MIMIPNASAPLADIFSGSFVSPFERLRQLLDGVLPGQPPIDLALGEPCEPMPAGLADRVAEATAEFARYPAIRGMPQLQAAIAQWLGRRYGIASTPDRPFGILPLNGSREGLFTIIVAIIGRRAVTGKAAVLMPNPCYPAYRAAALVAHADPVAIPAAAGALPDLDWLDQQPDLLARAGLLILCSPSNPEGAVADHAYLDRAIGLARQHGFVLLVDEAYSEIYHEVPPPGALQVAAASPRSFDSVIVTNSLSKRSSVPGLRSGFCAGDNVLIEEIAQLRNLIGPQMPGPVQNASAAIWSDETHVERARAAYADRARLAETLLGRRWGFARPAGGFFVWLNAAPLTSEEAALLLWRECGVRLLPGSYMSFGQATGNVNSRLRMALVRDTETLAMACTRLARFIDTREAP